jgi:hypothetical protein
MQGLTLHAGDQALLFARNWIYSICMRDVFILTGIYELDRLSMWASLNRKNPYLQSILDNPMPMLWLQ